MIESSFRASRVAAVGAAALPQTGFGPAGGTAIALSMIAVPADPEHRVASGAEANPLTKNDLAMTIHARREAGLDNGDRSWQVRTSSMCGYLLKVARLDARPLHRPGAPRVPASDEELYTSGRADDE